jgi:hypothetical protein
MKKYGATWKLPHRKNIQMRKMTKKVFLELPLFNFTGMIDKSAHFSL